MPQPANIPGLLRDPQFLQLDAASQKQVLGRIDPAFRGLSDADFQQFKQRVGGAAPAPAAPATEAPGFWRELYQQNVAPFVQGGSAIGEGLARQWERVKANPWEVFLAGPRGIAAVAKTAVQGGVGAASAQLD